MRVISVVNNKGGIGKTTSSINIAALLAEHSPTLLVDIDPQANATTGLGINPGKLEQSIHDVLIHNLPIKAAIEDTAVAGLRVLPSNIVLSQAENELLTTVLGRPTKLKNALRALTDNDYTYVVIDCPPSVGILTINALMASTDMVIPIEPEFYALQGIKILNKVIANVKEEGDHDIGLLGVLITKAILNQTLHQEVVEQIRKYFGNKVFESIIKKNVAIGEAAGAGQPISVYDPNSTGAQCYRQLVEKEILPQLMTNGKKK